MVKDNKERGLRTVAVTAVAGGFALMQKGSTDFIFGTAVICAGVLVYYFAHKVE